MVTKSISKNSGHFPSERERTHEFIPSVHQENANKEDELERFPSGFDLFVRLLLSDTSTSQDLLLNTV